MLIKNNKNIIANIFISFVLVSVLFITQTECLNAQSTDTTIQLEIKNGEYIADNSIPSDNMQIPPKKLNHGQLPATGMKEKSERFNLSLVLILMGILVYIDSKKGVDENEIL